ncbi:MAG: helix-turn-helix domain-containing protein [Nitrosomonas sp.]|nr:helix-turn-helix domain-containing protein [Nitrosomonas sp.]
MTENQIPNRDQIPDEAETDRVLPVESADNSGGADDEIMPKASQDDCELPDATSAVSSNQPTGEAADIKAPPALGELLRDERIRQGLSLSEVARRLCLSERQVTAIESQTDTSLPSAVPTFQRGYVRNYARLLRLANVDQLLQMLPHNRPTQIHSDRNLVHSLQPIKPLSSHGRDGGGKWLYLLLAIGLALIGYVLFQSNKLDQESPVLLGDLSLPELSGMDHSDRQAAIELPLPGITPSSPPAPPPAGAPLTLSSVTLPDQVKDALAGAKLSADRLIKSSATPESQKETRSLHFVFSRDSWVKVKDGEGNVILEKIHARGSEHTISGKPPLYLVIGNAAGVDLTYDGRKVDLAPYTRGNDDVARFSLE